MSATIEEIPDTQPIAQAGADVVVSDAIQNRAERKSRKGLQGLGLERVPGITRVTMRRARGHLYVINNPEVYKSSTADSYVVFGEGKVEDANQQQRALQAAQVQAQQQQLLMQQQAAQGGAQNQDFSAQADALLNQNKPTADQAAKAEDDEEPLDAEGLDENDITLVVQQANTTRNKAIKALKATNGDLINAIMEATS